VEYEENLALRYLAASVERAGFVPRIVHYDGCSTRASQAVLASGAAVAGISVPFQTRARDLLGIATRLRELGYAGHVTVGGHFATFEYERILADFPAVDSAVRHEGEDTLVELCALVRDGRPVGPIPGLVVREGARRGRLTVSGATPGIAEGLKRPLPELDSLAHPLRPSHSQDVLGVRCAPLIASRGCYADCSFCCIYAYADNADGARYRMRSPEDVVREMKREHDERGVCLFVFHDDNFFVPSLRKNMARYERFAALMRAEKLDDVGLVIKCRPNDVDRDLFALLKSMGMVRAYVGIETNSDEGVVSLNRRITSDDNERAMELLRELEVYSSFNVLIFDPEATLGGVGRNLDFMQRHADVPFNFCRAEVYAGTPLKSKLAAEGRLRGDYLAWTYTMRDPRVELLFRVATTAFAPRNFKSDGTANLNMGLRFDVEVLRRFYPARWDAAFHARVTALSQDIGRDTVAHMRRALAFASGADLADRAAAHDFTVSLARDVAASDLAFLRRVKGLRREMDGRALEAGAKAGTDEYARGVLPWAAETGRLGSSVGRDVSTEVLPAPSGASAG
jgi:hypothetical protein